MFSYNFDVEKLWRSIAHFIEYKELSVEMKKCVDSIFESICKNLEEKSFSKNPEPSEVFMVHEFKTESLVNDFGNWLIDHDLNLLFTNCYGVHQHLLANLTDLHVIKDYKLSKDKLKMFQRKLCLAERADIFVGLHLGIFCSGANESRTIVFDKNYPFSKHRLTLLREKMEISEIKYGKIEARRDINKGIKGC